MLQKKQGKNHNMSAIMAQGFAYHLDHPKLAYIDDLRDQHWLLLFCLVHTINREQELAALMVMSYLMGWGDIFHLHPDLLVFCCWHIVQSIA